MFVDVSCECGDKKHSQFFRRVATPEEKRDKVIAVKKDLVRTCINCQLAISKAKDKVRKPANRSGE